MSQLLIPFLAALLPFSTGILSSIVFGKKMSSIYPPGLLFHSIVPRPGIEMSHYSFKRFKDLCYLLKANRYKGICIRDFSFDTVYTMEKPIFFTFDDAMASVYQYALPVLSSVQFKATIFCLGSYFGQSSSWDIYSANRHCTRQQIRSIADCGFEIGSHTFSHPSLPYLNKESIISELKGSKTILEDISGNSVTSLSFPYGSWNRSIWEIAKELGYTAATLYRGNCYNNERLYPVLGVYQFDTPDDVIKKISSSLLNAPFRARAKMMSHFAKGTPIWKYRKEYFIP